ncbi:hypothetical protein LV779_12180 [Streptomyces thinghirensis]|nr:hypothetical protein [Streptomyces thinghirensis]
MKKLPEPVAVRLPAAPSRTSPGNSAARAYGACETTTARVVPDAGPERLAALPRVRACALPALTGWSPFRLPGVERRADQTGLTVRDLHHHRRHGRRQGRVLALPHPGQLGPGGRLGHHRTRHPPSPRSPIASGPETLYDRLSPTARASAWRSCRTRRHGVRHAGPAAARERRPGSAWSPTATCPPPAWRSTSFGETARMPAGPACPAGAADRRTRLLR